MRQVKKVLFHVFIKNRKLHPQCSTKGEGKMFLHLKYILINLLCFVPLSPDYRIWEWLKRERKRQCEITGNFHHLQTWRSEKMYNVLLQTLNLLCVCMKFVSTVDLMLLFWNFSLGCLHLDLCVSYIELWGYVKRTLKENELRQRISTRIRITHLFLFKTGITKATAFFLQHFISQQLVGTVYFFLLAYIRVVQLYFGFQHQR